MGKLPDILGRSPNNRYLTDRGIRQALDQKLIRVTPELDPNDTTRVQPATFDVKAASLSNFQRPFLEDEYEMDFEEKPGCVPLVARATTTVELTEKIDVTHKEFTEYGKQHPFFFRPEFATRSSIYRLGGYIDHPGICMNWGGGDEIQFRNYSPNTIHVPTNTRVAQIAFAVDPHRDPLCVPEQHRAGLLELREQVRELDMGIDLKTTSEVKQLVSLGYLEVYPKLNVRKGWILIKAGNVAYRMRATDGGIDFDHREEMAKALLEPISLKKGYQPKPYEHLVIEARETFKVSPHVGLQVFDNLLLPGFDRHLRRASVDHATFGRTTPYWYQEGCWIDPGYGMPQPRGGVFTLQPKWNGPREIREGTVLGFIRARWFERGVEYPYGTAALGSQYQGKDKIAFAK